MDGLAALVKEQLRSDPFWGAIYVFRAKAGRSGEADLVGWHGALLLRQAAGGRSVPLAKVEDGVMRLTSAPLQALLEGLDWRRVHAVRRTRSPLAAS